MCPCSHDKYCVGYNAPTAYCDPSGEVHPSILGNRPMDIITGTNSSVTLYVSQGIMSCTVVHYANGCADTSSTNRFGVSIHLYTGLNGTGSYVGSAIFFHLVSSSRKAQGTHNLGQQLIWPPYYNYLTGIGTLVAPDDDCSTAYHPHCEHLQATACSAIQCPDTAVAAASWLYRWGT
jgi:hypothetical protein